jgi:hypothetical protein
MLLMQMQFSLISPSAQADIVSAAAPAPVARMILALPRNWLLSAGYEF